MRRREFVSLLANGVAVVSAGSPLYGQSGARTQDADRVRRIGALTGIMDEASTQARFGIFREALAHLGWIDVRHLRIDYRWGGGNNEVLRQQAKELVDLAPDILLATGGAAVTVLLQATRSIPIVFVLVPDPVGSGHVKSLSRPGGNATGFMQFEYSLSGKWLELLKEIAPHVNRTAILWEPTLSSAVGQFAVIQAVAPSLGMEVIPINVSDPGETERALIEFARFGNGGLVVTSSPQSVVHRERIVNLAAQYKLPAVYAARDFTASGGLVSYSANFIDQYRQAAAYVDRILKGEKPGNLPVQAPTRYELTINLKTAKALGFTLPPTLLARADEVIE